MQTVTRICLAFVTLVAVLMMAACSSQASSSSQPSASSSADTSSASASASAEPTTAVDRSGASVDVTITPAATLQGIVLYVTGKTNLVDGSRLDWEVGQWFEEGSGKSYKSGKATVTDGRFSFDATVDSIPGSQLYAFLVFASGDQAPSVRAAYGEFGQDLRSPDAYDQGKYRMLERWLVIQR